MPRAVRVGSIAERDGGFMIEIIYNGYVPIENFRDGRQV